MFPKIPILNPAELALFLSEIVERFFEVILFIYTDGEVYQHRSQGLSSSCHMECERGETLAKACHVSPRIWEMTIILFKGGVGL